MLCTCYSYKSPTTIALGLLKNNKKKKNAKWRFFTSRGVHLNCAIMMLLYIHSLHWKSAVEPDGGVLKCVIAYLARDIPPFVMYCVYGKPRSSLYLVLYLLVKLLL